MRPVDPDDPDLIRMNRLHLSQGKPSKNKQMGELIQMIQIKDCKDEELKEGGAIGERVYPDPSGSSGSGGQAPENIEVACPEHLDHIRITSGSPSLLPLKIRLLPGASLPEYATEGAAGLDLRALTDWCLEPGERVRVPTGLCLEIPPGTMGMVRPRSGRASEGLVAIEGTIDEDYRGQVYVLLENRSDRDRLIRPGDRIAQLVIVPVLRVQPVAVGELSETVRGENGFGSTGVR